MLAIIAWIMMVVTAIVLAVDYYRFAKTRRLESKTIFYCEIALMLSVIYTVLDIYNFEVTLAMATIVCGVIWLADKWFFRRRRQARASAFIAEGVNGDEKTFLEKDPTYIEYSKSFFWVLVLVLVLRSFTYELFRIPSGSLEPTLLVGDLILVNKYEYGLRIPVVNKQFIAIDKPKRGDIAVVHWPVNHKYDFIKRVIGLPGDHIQYKDKVLYVNGKKAPQELLETYADKVKKREDFEGVQHEIYQDPSREAYDFDDITVPEGMYFLMGDNRDNSEDSRYWGFVSEAELVGKASMVVLSWDGENNRIRWERSGSRIKGGLS